MSFALDCHSGFGWDNSIWFPYARTSKEMAHLHVPAAVFEESYPHHDYTFEPQSHQYLLHGDLWNCAYDPPERPIFFC